MAQRDDQLYRSLSFKAERANGGRDVVNGLRRAIDEATRIHAFTDWREVGTLAGKVEQLTDALAELLKRDTPPALIELTEYAIERLETALEQIDDSDGEIGDAVCRLGELHLAACAMVRPDPARLAERLFRCGMTLPLELCSFDAATYRVPLGDTGLRRYRELAEAEWHKIKPRDAEDKYDPRRFRITRIMEQLAEMSGSVEDLVAIKARDLSSGYSYLQIAEIWAKAKQPDKALEWAERGLKAFPRQPDNRLRDFLVAAYLKRSRNDDALQLTWIQFEERPGLEHYQKLRKVAEKLGVWPAQRGRALSLVVDVIARAATSTARWPPRPSMPDHSLRVEIALWERDLDAAWAAAHEGICDVNLLIDLAGKLEDQRPREAISLYRRVVPDVVQGIKNADYAEAIKLVHKIGKLMKVRGERRQFSEYLAELRVQFKATRNFIKLLDQAGSTSLKS